MLTLVHPYQNLLPIVWTKGTLHAHGPLTGGKASPQQIIDRLAQRGYGFAMIVEHNVLPDQSAFDHLNPHGMTLLRGCELTTGPHLLHVNAAAVTEDQSDTQRIIDDAFASGGLVIAAHPGFGENFDHIPAHLIRNWRGTFGIEVYNPYILRTAGTAFALDKWDLALTAGARAWGFADNDEFLLGPTAPAYSVVQTDTAPDARSIIESLRQGRFYASTGPTFDVIESDGLTARVHSPGARQITATIAHGVRLAETREDSLEVTVPAHARYVRFQANGGPDEYAWTQPFWLQEL